MPELPRGLVTLLFTDIEGSTRLLHDLGDRYADALGDHRRILRAAFEAHGGIEVDTQGDAFFVAFPVAGDAVAAAREGQRRLAGHAWPEGREVHVRMGVHTGRPSVAGGGYVGLDLHRGARICAAAHGGQVLVSQSTAEAASGLDLRDLGEHRLKDLARPEHLFELVIPELSREFPPPRTLARPTNLPAPATELVGRAIELERARALLGRDDIRLLTFTGPGGTGKTRLAIEVGREMLDEFGSGVFFVPLAAVLSPAVVASAIAQALGVAEVPGERLASTLRESLADRELLLVLDNFEHVLEAAPLAAELLEGAPRLKVLVTSRAVLRLRGEREFDVPPLDDAGSTELFAARAADIRPGFNLKENAAAVAEICRRVDRLPLAIELVAAQTRMFTPQSLLALAGLGVGVAGARDLPARQQTLRGTISWSYNLLDAEAQKVFSRLAVFVDGCTLQAAEFVCGPGDVVRALTTLVEHSLVRRAASNGELAFGQLETIREYGRERLAESGEEDAVRGRHGEFFVVLAEEAERELAGKRQQTWMERLNREHANLRAAADFLIACGDAIAALRLCGSLWFFSFVAGLTGEWRERLDAALALDDGSAPSAARWRALRTSGWLALAQGEHALAAVRFRDALEVARRLDDVAGQAHALNGLGRVADAQGNSADARALLGRTLQLARDADEEVMVGMALAGLGQAASNAGDVEAARQHYEEALAFWRQLGGAQGIAFSLSGLGDVVRAQGDLATAQSLFEQALALRRELGDRQNMPFSLANLGQLALDGRRPKEASAYLEEALAIAQEIGSPRGTVVALEGLATVAATTGDRERALRLVDAATAMRERMGSPRSAAQREALEQAVQRRRA